MEALRSLGLLEWVQGNAPEPIGTEVPVKILDFLGNHTDFINEYPDLGSKMIKLLETRDLSKSKLSKTGWNTYAILMQKYPELFDNPPSTEPIEELGVLKNHPLSKKEFLDEMNRDSKELAKKLGCEESSLFDFRRYLQDSNNLNEGNVIEIIKLMQKISHPWNKDYSLFFFLRVNMNTEKLPLLLNLAFVLKHQQLAAFCLDYAWRLNIMDIQQVIQEEFQAGHSDEARILQKVLFLKDQGIIASFDYNKNDLTLSEINGKIYDTHVLNEINKLCQRAPVFLKILTLDLNDMKLANIMSHLPHLKRLFISDPNLTKIAGEERLEKIVCNCPNLTSLTATAATYLDCSGSTNLTNLTAPAATYLNCSGSTNLPSLNAQVAKELNCSRCTNLTSLNAPVATDIVINNCINLTDLNVPVATDLNCASCTSLIILTAQAARSIDCHKCTNLTYLVAPNTARIIREGCPNLTNITSPTKIL